MRVLLICFDDKVCDTSPCGKDLENDFLSSFRSKFDFRVSTYMLELYNDQLVDLLKKDMSDAVRSWQRDIV